MKNSFQAENDFLLNSSPSRLAKWISHWEVFKEVQGLPGDIVEIGVHKGASLMRWLTFREMTGGSFSRFVWGFDVFAEFPASSFEPDIGAVRRFVNEGGSALSLEELQALIVTKGFQENVRLVEGDVRGTIPSWANGNTDRRICLLHIDVDAYEPTRVVLDKLSKRIVPGGVILLDDYGKFPGETLAWDEFNSLGEWRLEKLPYHVNASLARRIK